MQISIASEEKSEIEKLIYSFNLRYSKELGDIVIKILKRKRDILENEPERKNEFNTADNDYQRYQEQHEAGFRREQVSLSQTELKELKQSFRKASKLCHPDTVAPDNKKNAEALFVELKAAYERNDLKKVKEILASLESNKIFNFRSDSTSELEQLLIEIEKLKIRLKEIYNELQTLKESDVYNEIIDIVDWGEYFETKKSLLIEELTNLEKSN